GVCRPPSSFVSTYTSALKFLCGLIYAGSASTCPRSTSSLSTPRSSAPILSPACPSSSSFRNISTPVTTLLRVAWIPTISTSSPTFTIPRSTRPVTTVPRPVIEKLSSIGIRNGLSTGRLDVPPGLRHRALIGGHQQKRPVHLRRPRDHVLDVVRVPRTVDVGVVPLVRLVPHVRHRDRAPPLPLFRRVIDRPVLPHRDLLVLRVQHLRDRRRQRRLAVVDVPDRPDVHVRLRPLVLRLRHDLRSSGLASSSGSRRAEPAYRRPSP